MYKQTRTHTVDVNAYRDSAITRFRIALEVIVAIMIFVNILIEFNEFLHACFAFSALEYITDP